MNKEVNVLSSNQTMSSLEIAKLTGKEHSKVMSDIKKVLEEVGIGHAVFSGSYLSEQNKMLAYFNLPRRECDLVIAGYSAKYRLAIIDRWQELEVSKNLVIPQTFSDALRLAADLNESLSAATLKIQQDKPKVDFAMAVRYAETACTYEEFSKTLGIGKNTFLALLRDWSYLTKTNLPYQRHLNNELFIVEENMPWTDPLSGLTHVNFAARITGKGQVALEKKYRELLSAAA